MSARLTRTLMRHTLNAGRKAVEDTARLGRVRNATTKRPIGRRIGYARVLTGQESCAFCAMLASRGPVYSEDTATRRADGRRYHDGCDCRAVLVIEGKPWEGEEEYRRLEAAWREATWEDGRPANGQWNRWKELVSAGGLAEVGETGAAPPKLGHLSRKRSKTTINSALAGANPTNDAENCIRCVNAWALRKLGYDAQAVTGAYNVPIQIRRGRTSAEHAAGFWRDRRGNPPIWESAASDSHASSWHEVVQQMESSYPVGSYGFIRARKPGGGSHVMGWEHSESGIVVADPQVDTVGDDSYLREAVSESIKWARIDGYRPGIAVVDVVEGTENE